MATKERPGPSPLPDFAEMGEVSEELKEYLFQMHGQLTELMNRVEVLENAS